MVQRSKELAKKVLLISFFIGLIDRIISQLLFYQLTEEDYLQFYFNMVGFEMIIFSCMMLTYAFLFNLCKLTKFAIITNTAFCALDFITTLFNTGDTFNDVFSIIIMCISILIIIAEIITTKTTKKW